MFFQSPPSPPSPPGRSAPRAPPDRRDRRRRRPVGPKCLELGVLSLYNFGSVATRDFLRIFLDSWEQESYKVDESE